MRKPRFRPSAYQSRHKSRPPPPFSVQLCNARLSTLPMVLSAVRIPIQWSHLTLQRLSALLFFNVQLRSLQRKHRNKHFYPKVPWFLRFILLPCLLFTQYGSTSYAIQGTNYALVCGDPSSDTTRQTAYLQTISSNFRSFTTPTSDSVPAQDLSSCSTLNFALRNEPISFV